MKLDEAFEKYTDDVEMTRPNSAVHNIAFLKIVKAVANSELPKVGSLMIFGLIEDANADDWEVIKEEKLK